MGFEVYLKYEKSLRGFFSSTKMHTVTEHSRSDNHTVCGCFDFANRRFHPFCTAPAFITIIVRVLNFLTLSALKIKKTLFGKRAFIYMEIIGLAFRSATSCCLATGRLRSLTAASVPPFPPFGRRSLRFESALLTLIILK